MTERPVSREEQINRLAQLHYQSEATEAIYVCGEIEHFNAEIEKASLRGERHWPEPWVAFDSRVVAVLYDLYERPRHSQIVGNSFGDKSHRVADRVVQTDGKRIVACVNALVGVPDPEKLMAAVRKAAEWYDGAKTACHGQFVFPHVDDIAAALKGKDPCSDA